MANKDLIRRAFSVTANLPPARTEDAIRANPSDLKVDELNSVQGVHEARRSPATSGPKTGPGSMLVFMTEQSEVHREVVQLRERLATFEGAEAALKLDPNRVQPSNWANRNEAHFQTESFARLKLEIASAGGNVQPIKVRPLSDRSGSPDRWEIVFGHRRHRACLELGIPVLALVQQGMKDADLFVEMERENREREDLSAWEQGVMYMRGLELGLFSSAKQMAAAIDRDMGNISRAMALAKLPEDVVRAFGSPLNLQFRWATPLKEAHQKDPERLLAAARALASREVKLSPGEVFAFLTRASPQPGAEGPSDVAWKDDAGKAVARLSTDRRGKTSFNFDRPLDASQRRKLVKLIDVFLGIKS